MDDKQILEVMDKGFATVGGKLEGQIAKLNEAAKKALEPKAEDVLSPEELKKAEDTAKMEQAGAVRGITDFEVWDIPVGQALVGGFTAVFVSELIDGFLVKQDDWMKGIVKLAGAGVAVKWGGRFLGSTGSKALAILLAYDGIRSLIPIDTWARRGATTVTGMIPGGGLGGFRSNVGGTAVDQAKEVASDYYGKAFGR